MAQGSEAVCAKKARDPELCFLDLCVERSESSFAILCLAARPGHLMVSLTCDGCNRCSSYLSIYLSISLSR